MPQEKTESLALLFADVSADVDEAKGRGKSEGKRLNRALLLKRWVSRLSALLPKLGGRSVSTVGNTLRCAFDETDAAVRAACDLQSEMADHAPPSDGATPHLRIGLHAGEVYVRNGNYAGNSVMLTAQLALLAKPGQVIASAEVFELASEETRLKMTRLPRLKEIEVRQGRVRVYEVSWREEITIVTEEELAVDLDPDRTALVMLTPRAETGPPTALRLAGGPGEADAAPQPPGPSPGVPPAGAEPEGASEEVAPTSQPPSPSLEGTQPAEPEPEGPPEEVDPTPQPASPSPEAPPADIQPEGTPEEVELTPQPAAPCPEAPPAEFADPTVPMIATAPEAAPLELPNVRLHLLFDGKTTVVDANTPSVSLGRGSSNTVVTPVPTASRNHADVVFSPDGFFLIDHSANGTFIYDKDGWKTRARDDSVELTSAGIISLGCSRHKEEANVLVYRIELG